MASTRAALIWLAAAAPAMSHDDLRRLRGELVSLQDGAGTSRALAALISPGPALLETVCGDRAVAVEYAADIGRAREVARQYRRYAVALEDGAARIDLALHAREDRLEVLAEVKGAGNVG